MAGPQQQPPYLHLAELTATQFLEIWKHFDADGNGYIEGKELENFFQELEKARKGSGMVSKSDNLGEKMKEFMQKYDKNSDGKIEMAELAQILPTEENFLLCFRQHVGSSTEFMEVRPRRCLLSCTLGPAFLSSWVKYLFASLGFFENLMVGFLSMRRNILMKLGIFSPKKGNRLTDSENRLAVTKEEASGPHYMHLSTGLLECPYNMAPGFLQGKNKKGEVTPSGSWQKGCQFMAPAPSL
ncbi:hypothetical protein FD755_006371 [Muntiacus reevesi]|uniref:EF-hand domain-containing protein n=1 Tax=Muntiacus reevesi TaxID=9886 RepID=A0A5J5MW25_MUNRE|nr:hypothetical protein FD755_006371 [Muntiacus reevesi]